MAIKKRDISMIPYLRQDARMSLTALSKRTKVPVATLHEHLKKLRRDGVLKLTALLDYPSLGFHTRILVALKIDRDSRQEIELYLLKHLAVNSIYRINNGFSYFVESVHKDLNEAEDYLEELDSRFKLRKKAVFYILGDIVRERFFSDPEIIDLL